MRIQLDPPKPDWRAAKQEVCPDCGNLRGIGFMPDCPHNPPPGIKGSAVFQVNHEDAEWKITGSDWVRNPKTYEPGKTE